MSTVAILGAGSIGASVAHRLASRQRVDAVRLIDTNGAAAQGKALDLRQSGPVEHFDTPISGSDRVLDAVGASVIVVADDVASGEWEGERGLALVRQIVAAGATAPIVFAGPNQLWLLEASYRELKVPANRLLGTAAAAIVSAASAWAALELNLSAIAVMVVGRPPRLVVGWSTATVGGALISDRVPAHRLLALSNALATLWPPGPLAIAAATAPVIEALVSGSRQLHPAMTVLDGVYGSRGRAALLPLEIGNGRVLAHHLPSLSPQERTEFLNGLD